MKQAGWDLFDHHAPSPLRGEGRGEGERLAGFRMPAFTLSLTLPRRGGGDWHIGLLLWLLALLLLLLPTMAFAADPVLRLDQAEFILSDAAEPPPDSAPWQPQTLPDYWGTTRPVTSGYA